MIGYHKDPNLKESSVKSRFTVLVLVDQKLRICLQSEPSFTESFFFLFWPEKHFKSMISFNFYSRFKK